MPRALGPFRTNAAPLSNAQQSSTPEKLRGQLGMQAFVVQIRRESLGSGGPTFESVCALSEDEPAVLTLVRTALRLEDEKLEIKRKLSDDEAHAMGLKPFQVKRMA
jgi:hypothetical protein